jgi:hypothetical protein
MRYTNVLLAAALLSGGMTVANAADETTIQSTRFDSKINSWAEGKVIALDADAGKFTIRGNKRPYATSYARMLQEIDKATANLNDADRSTREAEIRAKWADRLEKDRTAAPASDSDFTFSLPSKEYKLAVIDESRTYNRTAAEKVMPVPGVSATGTEARAMVALREMKVGDFMVVGYESGVLYNTAFTAIKAKPTGEVGTAQTAEPHTPRPESTTTTTTERTERVERTPINTTAGTSPTPTDADREQARLVRRAFVTDQSLSTAAQNVYIESHGGVVSLKGTVHTDQEKATLEQKALNAGAKQVINDLKVSPK